MSELPNVIVTSDTVELTVVRKWTTEAERNEAVSDLLELRGLTNARDPNEYKEPALDSCEE